LLIDSNGEKSDPPPGKMFGQTWWFYTRDWPPPEHDYTVQLKNESLRRVELKDWEKVQDLDSQSKMKFYEEYV